MINYFLLFISFGSAILGVFGKTRSEGSKGLKRVTGVGWFALFLATCALACSVYKTYGLQEESRRQGETADQMTTLGKRELHEGLLEIRINMPFLESRETPRKEIHTWELTDGGPRFLIAQERVRQTLILFPQYLGPSLVDEVLDLLYSNVICTLNYWIRTAPKWEKITEHMPNPHVELVLGKLDSLIRQTEVPDEEPVKKEE